LRTIQHIYTLEKITYQNSTVDTTRDHIIDQAPIKKFTLDRNCAQSQCVNNAPVTAETKFRSAG